MLPPAEAGTVRRHSSSRQRSSTSTRRASVLRTLQQRAAQATGVCLFCCLPDKQETSAETCLQDATTCVRVAVDHTQTCVVRCRFGSSAATVPISTVLGSTVHRQHGLLCAVVRQLFSFAYCHMQHMWPLPMCRNPKVITQANVMSKHRDFAVNDVGRCQVSTWNRGRRERPSGTPHGLILSLQQTMRSHLAGLHVCSLGFADTS